jgi:RsiW-degrading membrane proteinase PrsW (M82 family)
VALLWVADARGEWWSAGGALGAAALKAFVQAALPEEAVKVVALAWLFRRLPPQAAAELTAAAAAVRGAAFGLGFAAVESVLYAAHGGVEVTLVRGFTAIPCHVFLGSVMAHYLARFYGDAPRDRSALVKAFFVPLVLHGLYDYPLMVEVKGDARDGLTSLVLAGLVLALLAAWTRVLLTAGSASSRPRLP